MLENWISESFVDKSSKLICCFNVAELNTIRNYGFQDKPEDSWLRPRAELIGIWKIKKNLK